MDKGDIQKEYSITTDTGSEYLNNLTFNIDPVTATTSTDSDYSNTITLNIDPTQQSMWASDMPTVTMSTSLSEPYYDFKNGIGREPKLWQDTLPEIEIVNSMCKEYSALAKAYENFQTVYKLVEQDYKGKQKEGEL